MQISFRRFKNLEQRRLLQYFFAALLSATAFYLQWMTHFWMGTRFIVFYSAITLASHFLGVGPALLVTGTAIITAIAYAPSSLAASSLPYQLMIQIGMFIFNSTLIILIAHKFRTTVRRLNRQGKEFRQVFELSTLGMARVELQSGRMVRVNEAFAEMLGYNVRELTGLTFMDITHPEDVKKNQESVQKLYDGHIPEYRDEKRYIHKDGHVIWAEIVCNLSESPIGKPQYLSAIINDITDRKKLADDLKNSQRAAEDANHTKDLFLATVSHELRTPLTAMQMWAQMLLEGKVPDERIGAAYRAIEQNARTQGQLIGDLLDTSRILSGKLSLLRTDFALNDTISDSLGSLRMLAGLKSIQLENDFDAGAGLIHADQMRLKQIVWNLVSNAIKFSSSHSRIVVRTRRLGPRVEIEVSDSGKGVDAQFLPRIFDRFSQGDPSSVRQHGGLGLGLAIVRDLVAMHQGTVTARSPGPGQGSTFIVNLPAGACAESSPLISAPVKKSAPNLHDCRILLVDDSFDTREVVGLALESMGAEVKTADSAKAALVSLKDFHPTVLISDISMPDEDGISLIKKVRSLSAESGGDVPAIALTAYASEEDGRRMREAGFQIHLPKPVDWKTLGKAIADLAG